MPLVYETVVEHGQTINTGRISHTYRHYYGPSPFHSLDNFSMNVNKEDLAFFVETMNCEVDYDYEPKYSCMTLNYSKEENLVTVSPPGEFHHKEICFQDDFKKLLDIV